MCIPAQPSPGCRLLIIAKFAVSPASARTIKLSAAYTPRFTTTRETAMRSPDVASNAIEKVPGRANEACREADGSGPGSESDDTPAEPSLANPKQTQIQSHLNAGSAHATMSVELSSATLPAVSEVPPRILSLASRVRNKISHGHGIPEATRSAKQPDAHNVTFLAKGGYNDVWLARSSDNDQPSFVLRVPNDDALLPHQVQNEVGWLLYVQKHCSEVPVPYVLDYSDGTGTDSQPFIAQRYVEAPALSDAWQTYTETEKHDIARKIAKLIIRLGECRFDAIAGMAPDGTLGPTVEGCKLFKGRDAFHSPTCYDIGPYTSIKQYMLAYYDKEIYYYTHASVSDLDDGLFEQVSQSDFVQALKDKRASLETDLDAEPYDEPFVLCHSDLQGRNILMNGTDIAAVIDWEFAGSFPLSELEDNGVDVMEMDSEDTTEECFRWSGVISDLVETIASERGWIDRDVQLIKSGGNHTLQAVRTEMIPEDAPDDEADSN